MRLWVVYLTVLLTIQTANYMCEHEPGVNFMTVIAACSISAVLVSLISVVALWVMERTSL